MDGFESPPGPAPARRQGADHRGHGPRGEADRVLGLELGADDYVTKPFSPASWSLGSRPSSAAPTPRPEAGPEPPLHLGSLTVDPARHEVVFEGRPVQLTAREFGCSATWSATAAPGPHPGPDPGAGLGLLRPTHPAPSTSTSASSVPSSATTPPSSPSAASATKPTTAPRPRPGGRLHPRPRSAGGWLMGWSGGSLRGRLVLAFVAVAVLAAVLIGVITLSPSPPAARARPRAAARRPGPDRQRHAGHPPGRPGSCARSPGSCGGVRPRSTSWARTPSRATSRGCQVPDRRGPLAVPGGVDLAAALAHGQVVTGSGGGLAWAVAPASSARGGRGGVLLVYEVRRLGLNLLPVVAWRLLLATALAVAVAAWPPGCSPGVSPPRSAGWSRPPPGRRRRLVDKGPCRRRRRGRRGGGRPGDMAA